MTVSGFDGVAKHVKPQRELVESLKKNSGRNSYGRITVRHKGGGNRRKYRVIDFKRDKIDVEAKVLRLEYDPNRTAFIALIEYADGERAYEIGVNAVSGKIVAAQSALLSDIIDDATPGNAGVGGNGGQANNGVSGGDGNVNWHDDDTWEDWGESVGDYWENWGESVGDYSDKKFDF